MENNNREYNAPKTEKPLMTRLYVKLGIAVMVIGAIVGLFMGHYDMSALEFENDFSFVSAGIYWLIGIFAGLVLIGIGKIVEYLSEVYDKLEKIEKNK